MAKKKTFSKSTISNCCNMDGCGKGGCVYGLGFLGAVIYYISTATSFGGGVVGILKALVWPAFLVFDILKFIGA